jgi:hypothetical protein
VYEENVVFGAKHAVLHSADGPGTTIIDGRAKGAVVTINGAQASASELRGFTIRNGAPGVAITSASPTLVGNVITGNQGGSDGGGGGLRVLASQAVIRDNVIRGNSASSGGGVALLSATGSQFIGNTVEANRAQLGGGMTISLGDPLVGGNLFRENHADTWGGALEAGASSPRLVQNVFLANETPGSGGAITFMVPPGRQGADLVNNTFLDNRAARGTAISGHGDFLAVNNVISGPPTGAAVHCEGSLSGRYFYNDIYNGTSKPSLFCPDVRGIVGNISVDPRLAGDFSLRPGSPVIDAGHDDTLDPKLAPADGNGGPRVVDGDGDLVAAVDMGAFEFPGGGWTPQAVVSPSAVDLGTVAIGSSTTRTVTVTGSGQWTAHPGAPSITAGPSLSVAASTCAGASLAATESCSISVRFAPTRAAVLSAALVIPSDAGILSVAFTGQAVDVLAGRYLDRVVGELLGRPPTAVEITAWTPSTHDYASRVNLTVALVLSREARLRRVTEEAQAWLGHGPDPVQAVALVDAIGLGAIAEITPALFAGSDEFFARSGGTPEGFVDAIFRQLFGVTPDAAGRGALAAVLRTGYSRTSLAVHLLLHPAARGRLVDAAYQRYLGHAPTPAHRTFWVDTIVAGTRSEYLTSYLAATDEMWARAIV